MFQKRGCFKQFVFRVTLRHWSNLIFEKGVHKFCLSNFMSSEREQLQWQSEGLAGDQLSTENAIIILKVFLYNSCSQILCIYQFAVLDESLSFDNRSNFSSTWLVKTAFKNKKSTNYYSKFSKVLHGAGISYTVSSCLN